MALAVFFSLPPIVQSALGSFLYQIAKEVTTVGLRRLGRSKLYECLSESQWQRLEAPLRKAIEKHEKQESQETWREIGNTLQQLLQSNGDLVSGVETLLSDRESWEKILILIDEKLKYLPEIKENVEPLPEIKVRVDEIMQMLASQSIDLSEIRAFFQIYQSPKSEEDLIRDYSEKLRHRCQELDLFGVRGSSDTEVQLESIFVTLSFFRDIPAGGVPRIHRDDFPDDERVREYLSPYRSQKTIKADELFANPPKNKEEKKEDQPLPILILGMPGAGKTTLLKYQSLQYLESFQPPSAADSPRYLPIFIRLRNFVKHEGHFITRISEYLREDPGELFESDFLEQYLKAGKVAIFYDGLDEIANVAERNKMTGDIATFAKDYPKALHVVTCRIAAYPEITGVDMSSLAKFTIDDMDENQRKEFIQKWYRARASQWKGENVDNLAGRLIKKIENTDSIRRLAVNPLLLTIMAIIYSDLRKLPDTRLRLYEECVNVLMYKRDEATGQPAVDQFRSMMPQPEYILGELGYGLHKDSETLDSGIAEPPREAIYNRIAKIIIERRKVDDDYKRDAIRNREVPEFCRFIDRTSILVDREMGRYGFVHQTFQEYFAAYYLNTIWDWDKLWREIKDKIWSQYWREALLLLAEMLARRGDMLDVLLDKTMAESKAKEDSSHLLLLADIVIQGTPVTDVFKSTVLRTLYEKCLADDKVSGDYVYRLEKLGHYGLNEETYSLLEKDIEGSSDERMLWAIRYFSVRNDLIETCVERFEKAVKPYIENRHVHESLLPILGDLKCLAAPIFISIDIESLITPWYLPPVLLLYCRYLVESEQFAEDGYVLRKMSAGMFVCSSNFALQALRTLDPNLDLAWNPVLPLGRGWTLTQALDLNQTRTQNLAIDLVRALAQNWIPAQDLVRVLDEYWAVARLKSQDWALAQSMVQDWNRSLDLVRGLDRAQGQTRAIAAINAEPLFHGAMIHTATLLEHKSLSELKFGGKKELPPHLAYALEKPIDPENPYLRAAQLFRRFIKQEITPEEEGEFQRRLNIKDEKIRHLFDLAYLTEPETRKPIFRFSIGDRDEEV